jgi:hypothetical protein
MQIGTRAYPHGLRAHTRMDTVARHFHTPMSKIGGKLLKDDQSAQGVQDYLAEVYVWQMNNRRKGRYEPTQIVRNFWK